MCRSRGEAWIESMELFPCVYRGHSAGVPKMLTAKVSTNGTEAH